MNADDSSQTWLYGPEEIEKGVQLLQTASELIAHNGITFDNCVLRKLFPDFSTDDMKITDTLVLSRLLFPDLKNDDFDRGYIVLCEERRVISLSLFLISPHLFPYRPTDRVLDIA